MSRTLKPQSTILRHRQNDKAARRHISRSFFFAIAALLAVENLSAADYKTIETRHTRIRYLSDEDLTNFTWRISGRKGALPESAALIERAVDQIIERVMAILDMYPKMSLIDIILHPEYKEGSIAAYSDKAGVIDVYADRVTDGVLAHEMAHAVICAYFDIPPPEKIQEILCRYVDKQLWSDY